MTLFPGGCGQVRNAPRMAMGTRVGSKEGESPLWGPKVLGLPTEVAAKEYEAILHTLFRWDFDGNTFMQDRWARLGKAIVAFSSHYPLDSTP